LRDRRNVRLAVVLKKQLFENADIGQT